MTVHTQTQPASGAPELLRGDRLNRVAFPLGGMGAGMVCIEGTGTLSHVSLRHRPDIFHEPVMFSALSVHSAAGWTARVLEGPVPSWRVFGSRGSGLGANGTAYGLPRYAEASFESRFPFASIALRDTQCPIDVEILAWSPFEPGDADMASLPVAGLEFTFVNRSDQPVNAVYSFNASNFMAAGPAHRKEGVELQLGDDERVRDIGNGFLLEQDARPEAPWVAGAFAATIVGETPKVDCAWFRGGWFDPLTVLWNKIQSGDATARPPVSEGTASPGGSLFVPFSLEAGERKTIKLLLNWYVPQSNLRAGDPGVPVTRLTPRAAGDAATDWPDTYRPWYATRFASCEAVTTYWSGAYDDLISRSRRFSNAFWSTTLPAEVKDAVSANLSILKSPTVLRQHDGRFWAWEGCRDDEGSCYGTCTHVWNYAQAMPHLFPEMERRVREMEFHEGQGDDGQQQYRMPLPIAPAPHLFHAAADGQLGTIIKAHREWRLSGDTDWLRTLWPRIRSCLDYCIGVWDPDRTGVLVEPHHNTYDIEFWGPDGMCTSFYLGALAAAVSMGRALGEDVAGYAALVIAARAQLETTLFNGEYFDQKVVWHGLRAGNPAQMKSAGGAYSSEALALLEREGPKYQYGKGCLSDGILGLWLAELAGVDTGVDPAKIASHLSAVFRYNFKADLHDHANPQRPGYALGHEGGLLLCSWPRGGKPALPFVYSDEVWTGVEYQAACHLIMTGQVEEGLDIVRACRARYDGRVRNPFNEYECGHWYARALASYGLLEALSGARYDAVDQVLHLTPRLPGDFVSFLAIGACYGTVGIRNGRAFFEPVSGALDRLRIAYVPYGLSASNA